MRVWPVMSNHWDHWDVQHTSIEAIFDSYEKAKSYVESIPYLNINKNVDNSTHFHIIFKVDTDKVVEFLIPKEGMEVL